MDTDRAQSEANMCPKCRQHELLKRISYIRGFTAQMRYNSSPNAWPATCSSDIWVVVTSLPLHTAINIGNCMMTCIIVYATLCWWVLIWGNSLHIFSASFSLPCVAQSQDNDNSLPTSKQLMNFGLRHDPSCTIWFIYSRILRRRANWIMGNITVQHWTTSYTSYDYLKSLY